MGVGVRIRTAKGITQWRLCLGCGACAYICPEAKISLVDVIEHGIRPAVADEDCSDCRLCLDVCPAYDNDHRLIRRRPGIEPVLVSEFGPVLEVWEGYARDNEIRYRGASGGIITALALYCLERENVHGVLHLQASPSNPVKNRTHLSQSRSELLSGTGSRYAPGSVCDGLEQIESAPGKCVFIGQPCEVTALRKAQGLRPALRDKVSLAVSFFCAGSPATSGTLEVLRSQGLDPADVEEVRYRGLGWPGTFAVRLRNDSSFRTLMTYQDSWASLQRFRPYGVHLFPDIGGEDADISSADAWHRSGEGGHGCSMLIVRTERGRQVLHSALESGYLVAERVDPSRLLEAQKGLRLAGGAIWGRVLMFRLLGLPAPRLKGFDGAAAWWRLPIVEKLRSTVGTLRRILTRGYYRPFNFDPGRLLPPLREVRKGDLRRPISACERPAISTSEVKGKS